MKLRLGVFGGNIIVVPLGCPTLIFMSVLFMFCIGVINQENWLLSLTGLVQGSVSGNLVVDIIMLLWRHEATLTKMASRLQSVLSKTKFIIVQWHIIQNCYWVDVMVSLLFRIAHLHDKIMQLAISEAINTFPPARSSTTRHIIGIFVIIWSLGLGKFLIIHTIWGLM